MTGFGEVMCIVPNVESTSGHPDLPVIPSFKLIDEPFTAIFRLKYFQA